MPNIDRLAGLVDNNAWKNPCRVGTTANIVLNGLLTVDGVSLVEGDRVLVKNQSDSVANGIYLADTGAWSRAQDMDGPFDAQRATSIRVYSGNTQQGYWEVSTDDPITVGVTALSFGLASGPLAIISAFAQTLLDDTSASAARTTLGLNAGEAGDIWVEKLGDTVSGTITWTGQQIFRDGAGGFLVRNQADNTKSITLQTGGLSVATQRIIYPTDENHATGVGYDILNATLSATVAANALTVRLRNKNSIDPNGVPPVFVKFRNNTLSNGTYSIIDVATASTVVVPNTALLGTQSGVPVRLYVGEANDAGTAQFWICNPYDPVTNTLMVLDEAAQYSSTTLDNASDSAQVLYSTTAFTNRQIKILGYIEISQATAGVWASAPTKIHMLKHGDKKSGDVVRSYRTVDSAFASGTAITPATTNNVTSTQGTSFLAQTLTPQFAGNLLEIDAQALLAVSTTAVQTIAAIHSTQTTSGLAVVKAPNAFANSMMPFAMTHRQAAGTTLPMTFTVRAGPSTAATIALNGDTTAALFNGGANSYIRVTEIFQ